MLLHKKMHPTWEKEPRSRWLCYCRTMKRALPYDFDYDIRAFGYRKCLWGILCVCVCVWWGRSGVTSTNSTFLLSLSRSLISLTTQGHLRPNHSAPCLSLLVLPTGPAYSSLPSPGCSPLVVTSGFSKEKDKRQHSLPSSSLHTV